MKTKVGAASPSHHEVEWWQAPFRARELKRGREEGAALSGA